MQFLCLTLALLLLACSEALAAGHPRLFFSEKDLARIRTSGFQAEQFLGEKEMTLTYYGGKKVTFPLPPQQPGPMEEPPGFDYQKFGHYPYWTSLSKNCQSRMYSLSLAYAASGREDYARRAIDYALALAKWSIWTDLDYSKRTCLDTCHFTMGVAAVYDICYDRMTDDERRTIREAMIKLGLEPLMADIPERVEHNLQMLRASGLGIGGAAILGEDPGAEKYIAAAQKYYKWFLDGRFTSSNTEGLGYTSYGLEYCMVFADVLNRAAGDDSLLRHPAADMIVRMAIYFQCPRATGLVNFSDCGLGNYFPTTMKVLNNSLGNGYAGWYLQRSKMTDGVDWAGLIYGNPKRTVTSPADCSTSIIFSNIGWVAMRSGWTEDDTLFAFQSSSSRMGHNHRDQNNFVLNRAGEWLIVDPGYKSYAGGAMSFFGAQTVGHNTLLVDGEGQDKLGGAKVTSFLSSPMFDYTSGDASGSYDPSKLSKFVRRVAFIKPGYFVMFDDVASEGSPRDFELLFHPNKTAKCLIDGAEGVVGETRKGSEIRITAERSEVKMIGLLPESRVARLKLYEGAESYGPYISISPAEKMSAARFLTVLAPYAKEHPSAMAYSVVEGAGVVGVKAMDGATADTVLFRVGSGIGKADGIGLLGESCLVRVKGDELLVCALANGRMLERSGKKLIVADRNAGVGVSFGQVTQADFSLSEETEVRISMPQPRTVLIDGRPVEFRYDSSMLVLIAGKDDHKLTAE